MGELIEFPAAQRYDSEVIRLKEIADELDTVVLTHLRDGVDARDVAGILAHRLGTLMRRLDDKSKLWLLCEKILKKQADI